MTWAKVDDGLHKSVKWRMASKGARALWTTALSWANDELTDGFVPRSLLGYLGGNAQDARSLVSVGLWDVADNGWTFHNWAEYQPTRAEVERKREQGRERKNAYMERARNASGNALPQRSERVGNDNPDPTRPDPLKALAQVGEERPLSNAQAIAFERQPCGRRHSEERACRACGVAREQAAADEVAARRDKRSQQARTSAQARTQAIKDCELCDTKGLLPSGWTCQHVVPTPMPEQLRQLVHQATTERL